MSTLKCPMCSENKGIIQLTDNRYKDFKCLSCGLSFPMKHYSHRIKESENELKIEEVKF